MNCWVTTVGGLLSSTGLNFSWQISQHSIIGVPLSGVASSARQDTGNQSQQYCLHIPRNPTVTNSTDRRISSQTTNKALVWRLFFIAYFSFDLYKIQLYLFSPISLQCMLSPVCYRGSWRFWHFQVVNPPKIVESSESVVIRTLFYFCLWASVVSGISALFVSFLFYAAGLSLPRHGLAFEPRLAPWV